MRKRGERSVRRERENARTAPETRDVTRLLSDWQNGDQGALDRLMPLLYNELRRIAARCLHSERSGHTLQTTALVHEAYLRLVDDSHVECHGRTHFLGIAA
ncbi:MAG: hypothetical protein JO051_03655, partial [Acidobacteriaceae bacterium]|nr:hypothetical protein [Acidobacteriaceae bacterium]